MFFVRYYIKHQNTRLKESKRVEYFTELKLRFNNDKKNFNVCYLAFSNILERTYTTFSEKAVVHYFCLIFFFLNATDF